MPGNIEPFDQIEIDIDYCSRTFGVAPCTAALGGVVTRKCFNTFATCKDIPNFNKTFITYKFFTPTPSYPKSGTVFPYLVSVSGASATVNIAGSDDRMDALGTRGTVSARFTDHPYHDRFMDKYANERVTGAAVLGGVGYNPVDKGTFWTKFKARNPNYAGRPMRRVSGYILNGVITILSTRHFVISEIIGPGDDGSVEIKGKDILFLADNDKAVAPKTSQGILLSAVTAAVGQAFTLNPAGIGSEYAASGFGTIGSELVAFTRSGDVVTLTERGVNGTVAAVHGINDAFQQSYSPRRVRIDIAIADLLINYAGINPAFISNAVWAAEVSRWAPTLTVTTDILKPEGVSRLIGELAVLGISIWWDDVTQKIGLKINRPPDTDVVKSMSDRNNILAISQEDRDEDRLTEVVFYTRVINPTQSTTDEKNYYAGAKLIDVNAKSPNSYGDTKIKTIHCRWLNHGDDALVKIMSKRLLNRFNKQPVQYEITVDIEDDTELTEVISATSTVITDDDGGGRSQLMQIIKREEVINGHSVKLTAQSFAFNQRYGYITDNARPTYSASSAAQKNRGAYMVGPGLVFGDFLGAYRFI
jgi:hypothetical protein